jgi:thiol-disulfide isomerase/thioredoxin
VSPEAGPRRRARIWVERIGFALLLAAVVLGVRLYQQRNLVEGPAPVLQAPLLNGASFDLAASSAARPVLVYFWASWCPVCRLEQGSVSALLRDHPVVTVAMQSGSAAEVSGYLREHGLDWPVINDPDGALAARWGVRATPTFFVVDRERAIRFREVGYTSGPGLRLRLWLAR